jgi:hypothetical protein
MISSTEEASLAPTALTRSSVRFGVQDDVHTEGDADLGDAAAEPAEADDAKPLAADIMADPRLPFGPRLEVADFLINRAGKGQDQRPGELGGDAVDAAGAACGNALRLRLSEIEGGIVVAGRDEELQLRQGRQQRRIEGRALAHGHDDVEVLQRLDPLLVCRKILVEDRHLDIGQRLPVAESKGDVLIIVENGATLHVNPPDVFLGSDRWRVSEPIFALNRLPSQSTMRCRRPPPC